MKKSKTPLLLLSLLTVGLLAVHGSRLVTAGTTPLATATEANRPQPKGGSTATAGQVMKSLGSDTTSWVSIGGDVSGAPNALTVTDLTIASEARGDLLTRGAAAWQRLAPGTSGYLLQSNGAGADLSWVVAPSATAAIPSVNVVTDASTFSAGVASTLIRSDARLIGTTAAPSVTAKSEITSAGLGSATTFMRSDAQIQVATAASLATGTANAQGTASTLARSDHLHQVTGVVEGGGQALSISTVADGEVVFRTGTTLDGKAIGTTTGQITTSGDTSTVQGGGAYLDLAEQSSAPSTPSSGHARIYVEAVGGSDGTVRIANDSGADYPDLQRPGIVRHACEPEPATYDTQGAFVCTDGTGSTSGDGEGIYRTMTTGAVSGNNNYVRSGTTNLPWLQSRPLFRAKVSYSALTSVRLFAGFAQTYSDAFLNDDPASEVIGVRMSTSNSETTFQFIADSGSGSPTLVNSAITVVAGTVYILEVDYDSATRCKVSILSASGAVLASTVFTSGLPAASTSCNAVVGLATLTAATRSENVYVMESYARGSE